MEDEQKIADTLKFGLTENGYYVDVAYRGDIGYRLFQKQRYNLVLLDINIPGKNGYELSKLIRAKNSGIPIIMLTALSSLNDKIEGYGSGADDYLVKPFEFRELLLKIRVMLKRTMDKNIAAETILKAADLEMNLESKEVKRDTTTIGLTRKEFQLLQYLLENKNRVVSRLDRAANVWDIDFDTNTNVIYVYINYIRNKVDKRFKRKRIQTYVERGYILKEN
ncbi:MAG TPA: response regulator transcription factor [Segetibacter sp.]|nr:response regulator transcription factor [Segetibacter sp.]